MAEPVADRRPADLPESGAGDSPGPVAFATWHGEDVGLGAVIAALDELRGAHRRAASRTSVVNLLVVSDDAAGARRAATIIQDLNAAHPGRTVIINCSPARPPRIDADVALFESVADEEQVWWEEVWLRLGGEVCAHVHSLVEPLALADLPRVAWFVSGVPASSDPVAAASDVVVIDTEASAEDWADPAAAATAAAGATPAETRAPTTEETSAEAAEAVLAAATALSSRHGVVDLAWLRLQPVRELAARLFESPGLAGFLRGVERVTAGGGEVPCRLILGWVADRLGLESARTTLAPAPEAAIELLASDARGRGRFTVTRDATAAVLWASAEIDGRVQARLGTSLPEDPLAWSIAEALTHLHPDELYRGALARAA